MSHRDWFLPSVAGHVLSSGGGARYVVIAAFLLAVVAVSFVMRRPPAIEQPVAFNHRKHTQDLGLSCEFCHQYVRKSAHAGLPDATICGVCHRAVQGESEESARTTELINAGDPLKFRKLFRLAPGVYYTHRRHVEIAKLECSTCHGDIAESERPPPRSVIPARPAARMKFCLECHREREQSVDCTSCHR